MLPHSNSSHESGQICSSALGLPCGRRLRGTAIRPARETLLPDWAPPSLTCRHSSLRTNTLESDASWVVRYRSRPAAQVRQSQVKVTSVAPPDRVSRSASSAFSSVRPSRSGMSSGRAMRWWECSGGPGSACAGAAVGEVIGRVMTATVPIAVEASSSRVATRNSLVSLAF